MEPSVNPTSFPSFSPTSIPSSQPTSLSSVSTHWVVCGKDSHTNHTCTESMTVARDGELHGVRCCSDTSMDYWAKWDGCPWSTSELEGVCYRDNNYESAWTICASVGARLCSKSELEDSCSAGTGCELDGELIWSSTNGSPTSAPSVQPSVFPTIDLSTNPTTAHSNVPTEVHSIHPS